MKTGYFQYLWFLIWNRFIKNSVIYKLIRGIYDFFSSKWQNGKIPGWFRRVDGDVEDKSRCAGILGCILTFLSALQKKYNEVFTKWKENSLAVNICKYLLHNFLAVNLRFIGILSASGFGTYTLLRLICGGGFSEISAVMCVVFAVISIFDVNLTDYIKVSKASCLAENLLDTELNYKFYYMTKCSKSVARYIVAVLAGVVSGAAGAFLGAAAGLVIVPGILLSSMVMYKTEFGVFLTAMLAPFVPTMALAALAALCFLSFIVKAVTGKSFNKKFGIVGMFVALMLAVYAISALNSFAKTSSIKIFAVYAVMMSFFFVVINTIKTKKMFKDLCRAFAISGFLVCLYGLYQYFSGVAGTEKWFDEEMFEGMTVRIYSTLENPNVLGEYILLVFPVTIGLMWTAKKPLSKVFYFLLAAVDGYALVLTYSRGCWIAVIVAAALYITLVCGKLWGLALIALPLVPFVIPESIISRFTSIGDMTDTSTSYRVYIWLGTLNMLKDFWIPGVGMGEAAFKQVYPFYSYSAIVAPHTHNMFLQVWVETGIGGILAFLLLLFFFFKQLCYGHRKTADKSMKVLLVSIGAAVLAFMVQGMFDNCFYNYRVFMLFWFVLALGAAAVNIAKEERGNE